MPNLDKGCKNMEKAIYYPLKKNIYAVNVEFYETKKSENKF